MKKIILAALFLSLFFVFVPAFADNRLVGEWEWREEFSGEDDEPRDNAIYLSIRSDGTLTLEPDFFNWAPDTVHAKYDIDGTNLRITPTELETFTEHYGDAEFEIGKTTVCRCKMADGKLEIELYGQARAFNRAP